MLRHRPLRCALEVRETACVQRVRVLQCGQSHRSYRMFVDTYDALRTNDAQSTPKSKTTQSTRNKPNRITLTFLGAFNNLARHAALNFWIVSVVVRRLFKLLTSIAIGTIKNL